MTDWIDEARNTEKGKWTCESVYGKEIMSKMLNEYKSYSQKQIIDLAKEIVAFIENEDNCLHDRQAIEGMSSYYFEHIVPWNI